MAALNLQLPSHPIPYHSSDSALYKQPCITQPLMPPPAPVGLAAAAAVLPLLLSLQSTEPIAVSDAEAVGNGCRKLGSLGSLTESG